MVLNDGAQAQVLPSEAGHMGGLGRALDEDVLRAGFEDKGRLGALLRDVPCFRVCADDLALRCAAWLLEGKVRADGSNEEQ